MRSLLISMILIMTMIIIVDNLYNDNDHALLNNEISDQAQHKASCIAIPYIS